MSDPLEPIFTEPLTMMERAEISSLQRRIVSLFAMADTNPHVAYTVLLNVLGNLIGTQMYDEAQTLIARSQTLIPLYVEAYRTKEKRV